MFQFRRFPTYAYLIQRTLTEVCSAGFPHSEICGSLDMCSSPQLIAACHVLLRLLMPRHSPCALLSLTSSPGSLDPGAWFSRIMQALRDFSLNCNCYPSHALLHALSTIAQNFRSLSAAPLCCLAFALSYIVQFSRCSPDTFRYQISRLNPLSPEIQCQNIVLVGPSGLEPPTLRLSVVRSSQLSYGPIFYSLVEISGIEPLTSCLQSRRSPS